MTTNFDIPEIRRFRRGETLTAARLNALAAAAEALTKRVSLSRCAGIPAASPDVRPEHPFRVRVVAGEDGKDSKGRVVSVAEGTWWGSGTEMFSPKRFEATTLSLEGEEFVGVSASVGFAAELVAVRRCFYPGDDSVLFDGDDDTLVLRRDLENTPGESAVRLRYWTAPKISEWAQFADASGKSELERHPCRRRAFFRIATSRLESAGAGFVFPDEQDLREDFFFCGLACDYYGGAYFPQSIFVDPTLLPDDA